MLAPLIVANRLHDFGRRSGGSGQSAPHDLHAPLPASSSLSGFVQLFTESDVVRWILNTVIVSTAAVLAQLLLCSLAGYASCRVI